MPIWNRKLRFVPAWKRDWYQWLRVRCTQRILIVTDTFDSFDPSSSTGLTELIRVLEGAGDVPANVPAVVTKVSKADGFSFETANPAVTTANYDQVWLFGFLTGPASADVAEQRVLSTFMEAGGGVFATGDHSDIGRPLCGALARVRKMREWSAVPMLGPTRIDTLNEPGSDTVTTGADQSDNYPQRTFPLLDAGGAPHPLLRSPAGPINVAPDHPHESECYAPRGAALADTITIAGMPSFPEFPALGGVEHGPQIVSISMSASLNEDKGPVTPRCFAGVAAYDGHPVNKGRVVCDSTWHHFVNMNLNSANPYGRAGMFEGTPLAPNDAYRQIQRYYANIAAYLSPRHRIWCRLLDYLILDLYEYPVFEEIVTLPPIPPRFPELPDWPRTIDLGGILKSSLDAKFGRGAFDGLVVDLLSLADVTDDTLMVLHPGLAMADGESKRGRYDDPAGVAEMQLGLAGHVILRLREVLPENPNELTEHADRLHDEGPELVRQAVAEGLKMSIAYRRHSYERNVELLGRLR